MFSYYFLRVVDRLGQCLHSCKLFVYKPRQTSWLTFWSYWGRLSITSLWSIFRIKSMFSNSNKLLGLCCYTYYILRTKLLDGLKAFLGSNKIFFSPVLKRKYIMSFIALQSSRGRKTESEHEDPESSVRRREARVYGTAAENKWGTEATLRAAATACIQTVTGKSLMIYILVYVIVYLFQATINKFSFT